MIKKMGKRREECCFLKPDQETVVHLYHTNDLHSHFEEWSSISRFVRQEKQRHKQQGEAAFILDIGDHIDRFHVISEATGGKGNVKLLNEAEYDYVTIGNNEGITLSKKQLAELYEEAKFQVLLANLFEENGSRPSWTKLYDLYTLPNGAVIAFFGLTVAYEAFYSQLGWKVGDPYETLQEVLAEIRHQADAVILLSHLGRNEDEYIAAHYDIDVILGAHTHHLFETGLLVNDTLLCCTGKWGQYVGHVKLQFTEKRLTGKQARVISSRLLGGYSDTGMDHSMRMLQEESEQLMNEPVVELKEALHAHWYEETAFNKLLADSLKEWCDAEIGMLNAGVLLDSLPQGHITRRDIHRICPHPINPCRLLITGKTLRDVIIKAHRPQTEQLEIKGLGFRGKVMGKMIYSGLEVTPDDIPGNKLLLKEVLVNGCPLEPERVYSVGTLDMFTFGYIYPELANANEKKYFMPELLRDVLQDTLMKL